MKLSIVLPAAGALIAGYVLGTAAGRSRYRQISAAVSTAVHHPRVQQLLFDLAGRASNSASHIPGPAADLVDTAATHLQDTLTQPDQETDSSSAPGSPSAADDDQTKRDN